MRAILAFSIGAKHGNLQAGIAGWLEFHHVVPYARGGQATVENITLRCRAHNQYEAILDFAPRDFPIIREVEPGWPGVGIQPQLGPGRVVD